MTWFKALDGVKATNGGSYRYPGVGRSTRHIDGELEACRRGYHLARDVQILDWLAPTIYIAEPCTEHEPIDAGNKWVTCRVTLIERLDGWNDRTARLFAADCAEGALLGERASGREPDERSWAAVVAARQFANGEIGATARDAARDTAWPAAWPAAERAARAAARAATEGAARAIQYERFTLYIEGGSLPPVVPLYGADT